MNSLFPDILSKDLTASKKFYESLLELETVFELDWYVHLVSPANKSLQIAFVSPDHDSVPVSHRQSPQGMLVTVEMDDVDTVYQRAKSLKLPIIQDIRDEAWGQRHFIAEDPNGLMVDLVQAIEPSAEFAKYFQ